MKNEFNDTIRTLCLHIKAFRAHYSKGDYLTGLKLYQQIIDSGHPNTNAYWGLGFCNWSLGNNEAAIAAAKKALEIKSDYFRALQLLAKIYSEQKQDDLTYEYVTKALSNIPRWPADDEDDQPWITWTTDFKKEYEARNSEEAQVLTKRIHSDASDGGA